MPDFLSQPVPNKEAAAFLAGKPVVSREVFDRLLPDLRARAFVISGVENANVVQAVRDRIAEIPQGVDWDMAKEEIAGKISPWLDQGEGNAGRAELLMRQHGYQAYSVAQEEVGERQRSAFPYAQYQSAEDERVRDSHAALNGIVLPADHPFWETHTPPWEWGCRCYKVFLSEDDVREMQAADAAKKPEERRVLDVDQLRALQRNGVLMRALPQDKGVPRPYNVAKRDDGFGFNPRTVKMDAAQLRERYDPETWRTFETWAKAQPLDFGEAGGRTVWEWLNRPAPAAGSAARRAPTVQRVTPPAAPTAASPVAGELEVQRRALAATVQAEREAIEQAAYKSAEKVGGAHVNVVFILTNGRKVVFKPVAGEYRSIRRGIPQGAQYRREIAASLIDEELGIGLVPPTTLLRYQGQTGSAQLFRAGFRTAGSFKNPYAVQKLLPDRVRHDWQLLDDLLNHLDRHPGNYMFRVTGTKVELALIDHGHTLSSIGGQAKVVSGPLEGRPIDAVNRQKLTDLLNRETEVRARLEAVLDKSAVDLFFERARGLLKRGTYGDI